MNKRQERFAMEYIRTGNATEAYQIIYGVENEESARVSAARLLERDDIDALVRSYNEPMKQRMRAEIVAEAEQRIKREMLSNDERRYALADMVKGRTKVRRHFKYKDHSEEVIDDPSPMAILRAIELDTKLELGWFN